MARRSKRRNGSRVRKGSDQKRAADLQRETGLPGGDAPPGESPTPGEAALYAGSSSSGVAAPQGDSVSLDRCDLRGGTEGSDTSEHRGASRGDLAPHADQPPCAICGHAGKRTRSVRFLTRGVSVWLCGLHSNDEFLHRHDGTAFTQRLGAMWLASGSLTSLRVTALRAHVRQVQTAGGTDGRPGSYSWPMLRREAEERFAAGHDPRKIIQELRARHRDCPALAPSIRTMRRWYTQARWLASPPSSPDTRDPASRRRRTPAQYMLFPTFLAEYLPRNDVGSIWRAPP